ncbi:DNA repair protein RecO [Cryomorphaceae bacterium]|nr:DNA repair protein RecO [Cryomorphaceae bacterium]
MLVKTPALVLHHFPYGERSTIVRMYTKDFGLQSYLIPSPRSKKSPISMGHLLPLQELGLVAYHHREERLERIKEVQRVNKIETAHEHPVKTAIAQFMAEVVLRVCKDQEPHPELYAFISASVGLLDLPTNELGNLPLFFALRLTEYLGYYPHGMANGKVFDLREGVFQDHRPSHPDFADSQGVAAVGALLNKSWEEAQAVQMSSDLRYQGLQVLELYHRNHLNEQIQFKSLEILHVLLS